ncbi:hypothetical protein B296_00050175 [Ensete ventricosum]|uniref:Cyclin-dependent kinases regulatory subunit n=1 Tax=Ensete ventricosum TaxID=4639 RepID=A0A426X6G2_ENSVE|nr:hypothetical protein B296_00050175 [Ensete ventricosum]
MTRLITLIILPVLFKFQTALIFKLTTQSLPSPVILCHILIKSQPSNFSSPLYINLLLDPHRSRSSRSLLVSVVISCPENALALPLLTVCTPSYLSLSLSPNVYDLWWVHQNEWRAIGVQQSRGWVHYAIHRPEPHIMLFRRPLNYQQQQVNHAAAVQAPQMLAK